MLGAEIPRIHFMAIDQANPVPGAPEDRRCKRSGNAASYNQHVREIN
jgi:hypothetical protein